MKRYVFFRSMLLSQTWTIVAFALSNGDTLTGALLNHSSGGVIATVMLAIASLLLTIEFLLLPRRGIAFFSAAAGPGYMLVSGLLLGQMYVMSIQDYFGPLFWLYLSLAVHAAILAWLLSHPVSAGRSCRQSQY